MGNRCIVTTEYQPEIGIYLHDMGDPEYIEAALRAAKKLHIRSDTDSPEYWLAGMVQIFRNLQSSIARRYNAAYANELGVGIVHIGGPGAFDMLDQGHYVVRDGILLRRERYGREDPDDIDGPVHLRIIEDPHDDEDYSETRIDEIGADMIEACGGAFE